jgi:hypothetical protein
MSKEVLEACLETLNILQNEVSEDEIILQHEIASRKKQVEEALIMEKIPVKEIYISNNKSHIGICIRKIAPTTENDNDVMLESISMIAKQLKSTT